MTVKPPKAESILQRNTPVGPGDDIAAECRRKITATHNIVGRKGIIRCLKRSFVDILNQRFQVKTA
jgi:hypothetical protein